MDQRLSISELIIQYVQHRVNTYCLTFLTYASKMLNFNCQNMFEGVLLLLT